jgi:YHS domain-containing protein
MKKAILAALMMVMPAFAVEPIYKTEGVGLSGYDPVAYFIDKAPVKGRAEFQAEWGGAKWLFKSSENRSTFLAAPEKYAPQYGGYCSFGVSRGHSAPGDPSAWKIVNGKLYVNNSKKVQELWEKELPDVIARGDQAWPGVLKSSN